MRPISTPLCRCSQGNASPTNAARQFLEDVREHAALLLERGPGEYGFIHLTFEEYLSAVALALKGQGDAGPIAETLVKHVGEQAWRELTLLTIGYIGIRQQLSKVSGDVVERLIKAKTGAPGEAVILAGDAVLDTWPSGVPLRSQAPTRVSASGATQTPGMSAITTSDRVSSRSFSSRLAVTASSGSDSFNSS